MAYAEKRSGNLSGRWVGQARIKGETLRRIFEARKEALGYEAYCKASGCEPETTKDAVMAGPTFEAVVEMARRQKDEWKGDVRDKSGQHRLNYLISVLGHEPIGAITPARISKVIEDLAKRPNQKGDGTLSKGTLNRYMAALSAVLKFARDQGLTENHPTVPFKAEEGKRIHWLTVEQEKLVTRYMTSQGWLNSVLTVRVLTSSGMRWSEFSSLEPHQCQAEWIKLDRTKTNRPRDIPIHPRLLGELRAMVVRGEAPDYRTFRIQLKSAIKACGLAPEIGIHNLRHSTATRLTKSKKVPGATIQKLLGHKSYETTLKYTHIEDDDLMDASTILYTQCGPEDENAVAEVIPFASKVS